MATFCKTSKGGFNLEQVTDWFIHPDGEVFVYFAGNASNDYDRNRIAFDGKEAHRLLGILNGACIFDTTQERAK